MCIRDSLIGDPFANYKIRLEKVDRGYLSEDEIKIILKKKMVSERLPERRSQRKTFARAGFISYNG